MAAMKRRKPKGGTYLLLHPETGQVLRTGRTKDLERRRKEHARELETELLEFQVDRYTDSYAEQRGREQIIHDLYDPPLDLIQPISPRNPRRQKYLDAAQRLEQD